MAITNITPLPTPPTRQDPVNFANRADTFLAALPTFTTEVNTAGDQIEAAEQAAKNAQIAAENAANAAALSANEASVTANAAVWVSGSAYSQYSNAIDPVDYRTYRAKNAVTSTTRPALDSTNWALLSAQGDVTTDTDQTITSVKTFTQPIVGSTTKQVLKAGDTMTGPLSVPAGASGAQVPRAQEVVSKTGDTMTGNLNVPSINGGQLAGMRNKIINGKMEIAQRGTSFAAVNSYTLDRWYFNTHSGPAATVSQQSDVPSNNEFLYSLRATITTADTSIAADDFGQLFHSIEGYNVRDLIGRTFSLSFWVRSSKTGIHCVAFKNSGGDRAYVAEYTINAANTWEYKTITVSGGLITAGTWNWINGVGLNIRWILAAGSNFQTTAGAWQTGNFLATANQVNVLDTVDNIFAITGVQLEVGSVATPFEHRPYGTELALCQRYCYQRAGTGAYCIGQALGASSVYAHFEFPVPMRTAPTLESANSIVAATAGGSQVLASTGTIANANVLGAHINLGMSSASFTAGDAALILGNAAGSGARFTAEL